MISPLFRGRITIGTLLFVLITVGLRGYGVWSRQQNARAALTPPPPTFVAPAAAMVAAQVATAQPTPFAVMEDQAYVNTIWGLLEKYMTQIQAIVTAYDGAVNAGMMQAPEYNQRFHAITAEAYKLHELANKIRAIHPPERFTSYHADILQAIQTVEDGWVKTMQLEEDDNALTEAEQDLLNKTLTDAAKTLTAYPRTNGPATEPKATQGPAAPPPGVNPPPAG